MCTNSIRVHVNDAPVNHQQQCIEIFILLQIDEAGAAFTDGRKQSGVAVLPWSPQQDEAFQ